MGCSKVWPRPGSASQAQQIADAHGDPITHPPHHRLEPPPNTGNPRLSLIASPTQPKESQRQRHKDDPRLSPKGPTPWNQGPPERARALVSSADQSDREVTASKSSLAAFKAIEGGPVLLYSGRHRRVLDPTGRVGGILARNALVRPSARSLDPCDVLFLMRPRRIYEPVPVRQARLRVSEVR